LVIKMKLAGSVYPLLKGYFIKPLKLFPLRSLCNKKARVISGYKTVTETVPRFKQKQVLAGHKTINDTIPVFEECQVQVGTKTVKRQMPDYETVRVVAGYDEIPNHQENSLDAVEQKNEIDL